MITVKEINILKNTRKTCSEINTPDSRKKPFDIMSTMFGNSHYKKLYPHTVFLDRKKKTELYFISYRKNTEMHGFFCQITNVTCYKS